MHFLNKPNGHSCWISFLLCFMLDFMLNKLCSFSKLKYKIIRSSSMVLFCYSFYFFLNFNLLEKVYFIIEEGIQFLCYVYVQVTCRKEAMSNFQVRWIFMINKITNYVSVFQNNKFESWLILQNLWRII